MMAGFRGQTETLDTMVGIRERLAGLEGMIAESRDAGHDGGLQGTTGRIGRDDC